MQRKLSVLLRLFAAVVIPAVANSFTIEDRYCFRDYIGMVDYVLIGRIVGPNSYNRSVPERESILLVEEVFSGNAVPGDSLTIKWKAAEWFPQKGSKTSVVCGAEPQLDDFHGATALWLLFRKETAFVGIKSALGPYVISRENKAELVRLVELLDNPKPDEQSILRAAEQGRPYQEPIGAAARQKATSLRLKELLEEIENGIR
ncbi:MAG: hypothetical protein KOO63_01825 [Bacteroidales bacterium]|nr:hypothetical protein [Candidatus Latescibacterota bacterium]